MSFCKPKSVVRYITQGLALRVGNKFFIERDANCVAESVNKAQNLFRCLTLRYANLRSSSFFGIVVLNF